MLSLTEAGHGRSIRAIELRTIWGHLADYLSVLSFQRRLQYGNVCLGSAEYFSLRIGD